MTKSPKTTSAPEVSVTQQAASVTDLLSRCVNAGMSKVAASALLEKLPDEHKKRLQAAGYDEFFTLLQRARNFSYVRESKVPNSGEQQETAAS